LLVELIPLRTIFGHVEDKDDDGYAQSFQNQLESVHCGMSSAFLRDYNPITPPLPPLPMDVDIDTLMTDFRKIVSSMPKRRRRRFGRQRSL
jgi:hypothetical protein